MRHELCSHAYLPDRPILISDIKLSTFMIHLLECQLVSLQVLLSLFQLESSE